MKQDTGDNSTNYQANGDINIASINYKSSLHSQDKGEIPKSKIQKEEVEKQNIEISVKEGGYIDVPWKLGSYRITLKNIVNEAFDLRHLGKASEGVELLVNANGGLIFGGEYAKRTGVNQWKIPLSEGSREEPYSVYSHFVFEGRLSFFRCFVSHINPHSREATLNIYMALVSNSA